MQLIIVYGAPMSGKTTYVRKRMMPEDIVYDYDALTYVMTQHAYQRHHNGVHDLILSLRDSMIGYARWHKEGSMYIITTFLSKSLRHSIQRLDMDVTYVKMATSKAECIKRLSVSERPDKDRIQQTIHDWYQRYNNQPASDRVVDKETMQFYKSKAWRDVRAQVLKRDNYECQACKQQGKVTTIDKSKHKSLDVDHIRELDTHPELAFDMDNLVTLCVSCHNKKHHRYQNRWKKIKDEWKDEKW